MITIGTGDKAIAGHLEASTEVFTYAIVTIGVLKKGRRSRQGGRQDLSVRKSRRAYLGTGEMRYSFVAGFALAGRADAIRRAGAFPDAQPTGWLIEDKLGDPQKIAPCGGSPPPIRARPAMS